MKNQHTPGPWKSDGTFVYQDKPDPTKRVACCLDIEETQETDVANAKFIALACTEFPAMLDALKECAEAFKAYERWLSDDSIASRRTPGGNAIREDIRKYRGARVLELLARIDGEGK